MRRVFGIALMTAFVCFASGQDWAAQYKALQRLESKEDPKRFEQFLAFLEKCPNEWADRAFDLIEAARERILITYSGLWRLSNTEADPAKKAELVKAANDHYEPLEALGKLQYIDRKQALPLVRELAQAARSKRVALLKWYAELAGKDELLKDDMVWFGPWCGTYDHTNEHKIEWAAQRYPKEATESLRDTNWNGRRFLLISLGNCKDPALKPILMNLSNEPNTLARGQALLSLGDFSGADVESVLINALQSKSADTRAKALHSIGRLKIGHAVHRVFSLCKDAIDEVKWEAIQCLGKLGTPVAGEYLTQLLKDPDALMRTMALREIDEGKYRAAVPILQELFADKNVTDRSDVLSVLSRLDPAGSEEIVLMALSETAAGVLQSAIDVCKVNKYRSAIPALHNLLTHQNLAVRKKATEAYEELVKPPHVIGTDG